MLARVPSGRRICARVRDAVSIAFCTIPCTCVALSAEPATGPKIQGYLDGKQLLDHEDKTFTDGWVGLWTKADSVTEFADLEVSGTVVK